MVHNAWGAGMGRQRIFKKLFFSPKLTNPKSAPDFSSPGTAPPYCRNALLKKIFSKKNLGGGGWGGQGGVERFTVIVGPGYGPFMSFFSVSAGTANSSVTQPALRSVTFSGDPRAESPTPMV